jgi:hypothetical protein
MAPDTSRRDAVFSVHTTRPDEVGAIEILFDSERAARTYAQERSLDHRVLSASVTRFVLGELGTRQPITWFVDGVEQPRRYDRRLYPSDGGDHGPAGRGPRDRPRPRGTSPCADS